MPYFEGIAKDKLKAEYRRLAQKMHPDKGGDTKLFQDMKREYEQREAGTYRPSSSSGSSRGKSAREMYEDMYADDHFDDYFKDYDKRYQEWSRDFDRAKARERAQKPKREPKYHTTTVNFAQWMKKSTMSYQYDGKEWDVNLNPSRTRVTLDHNGETWIIVTMLFKIDKIKIVAREENLSKKRGWIIADVYADNVYIGMYVCRYRDLMNGNVKFDKNKVEHGFKQTVVDLSEWSIGSCSVEFERWKKPDEILERVGAWFERKFGD